MRLLQLLSALTLVFSLGIGAQAAPYTFAGFTFEQTNTPNQISLIGNGAALGGATFSNNVPNTITRSTGFGAVSGTANSGFSPVAGWVNGLSIGQLARSQAGASQGDGTGSLFTSALNMPRGNDGTSTRHGLTLSWLSGVGVVNGAGNDFVVYESGSAGSPEGFMVRVGLGGGQFTNWFFSPNDGFQQYVGSDDGAFATAFDLSDLGVAMGQIAYSIEIANLISSDRIPGATGGFVNFNGVGQPTGFAGDALDPDPLYIGIIGNLALAVAPVPEPASLAVWTLIGVVGAGVSYRRRKLAAIKA